MAHYVVENPAAPIKPVIAQSRQVFSLAIENGSKAISDGSSEPLG